MMMKMTISEVTVYLTLPSSSSSTSLTDHHGHAAPASLNVQTAPLQTAAILRQYLQKKPRISGKNNKKGASEQRERERGRRGAKLAALR